MRIINPYKRIQEIDAKLEPLEQREKEFKRKAWKRKPVELDKIESEIFFLVIEREHIQRTINYFEAKIKELRSEGKWKSR